MTCPDCSGSRLNETARSVLVQGTPMEDITEASVQDAAEALNHFQFKGRDAIVAKDVLREVIQRLRFLDQVGLGYLGLNRSATTLSGGEAQRIRLASQLGSNLRGVLYVLDEPTIGLHQRDNVKLLDTLENLRDQGNSLIVVEHDDETMRRSNQIVDLGPGAGKCGGEVIAPLLESLLKLRTPGYDSVCWGYDFDWQQRKILVPKYDPNIICTTFGGNALLDAYEHGGGDEILQAARGAGDFVMNLDRTYDGEAFCFSYTLRGKAVVHNAL